MSSESPPVQFSIKMKKPRYVVTWKQHPDFQTSTLCQFFQSGKLVDITLRCNSDFIKVHKCVLAAHSTYFEQRFTANEGIQEITIQGITWVIVKFLVRYMYFGEISVPKENMQEFILAAKFFCIQGLSSLVYDNIVNPEDGNNANKPPMIFFKNKPIGNVGLSYTIVSNDTCAALAKEEEPSRKALAMISEMNNSPNVLLVDDTGTEAMEPNLVPACQTFSDMIQAQECMIENPIYNSAPENFDIYDLMPTTQQYFNATNTQPLQFEYNPYNKQSPVQTITNYPSYNTRLQEDNFWVISKPTILNQTVGNTINNTHDEKSNDYSNQIASNHDYNVGVSKAQKDDLDKLTITPPNRKKKVSIVKPSAKKSVTTKKRGKKNYTTHKLNHNTTLILPNYENMAQNNALPNAISIKDDGNEIPQKSLQKYKELHKTIFGESP